MMSARELLVGWTASRGVLARYGLAVLSVALALGVSLVLQAYDITVTPFLLAIAFTVWRAGMGPGFLAIVLSLLSQDYFFIQPLYQLAFSVAHVDNFIVFTLLALVVSAMSASRRRAERVLRNARDELEVKVAERTAELQRTAAQRESILEALRRRRQDNLWFFESMDRVNRAMQGTNDLERMMSDVLEAVRAIFECDRAWLVYPCDPDAASWRVPMEHTRPEYPGAFALKLHGAVDADIANAFRMVRASDGPVRFGAGAAHPLSPQLTSLSVQSQLAMCIDPKIDKPYMFGLHQCSHARVWTLQEEQLFQQIGRRLADALRTLLTFRNLQESEAKLASAQRIAHVGYWHRDVETDRVTWSDETYRIFGLPPQQPLFATPLLQQIVHPDDRPMMLRVLADAQRGIASDVEYRALRPDGDVRIVLTHSDVVKDDAGRPIALFGTVQDITDRKRAEQLLEDLAGRLISAQEEERRRIGRELHDHICQQLSLLAIAIDQIRATGPWPATLEEALGNLHQQASDINDDVHGLSHRLHSTIIDHLGFVPAVNRLIAEWSGRNGIRIEFTHDALSSAVSSDVALCLFRVAEESLANIAKHSGAKTARVEVTDDGGGIGLSIEDDGAGFQPEVLDTKAGLGFISMRERLRILGGTVRVQSVPSRGTRVDAWVPAAPRVETPPAVSQ